MRFRFFICLLLPAFAVSAARIKDIATVEGGRDNQLVGYGLVTGLAGDGDGDIDFTVQSVANALERFGIQVPPDTVDSTNVAAVMVTADIGPFIKPGTRIDVTVSSIGDAESLQGGILLQTPLLGADGTVYAVAQGAVAVGGFIGGAGGQGGATVQKNHPTVGIVSGGAIVEREIPASVVDDGAIRFLLRNPDFTTAVRLADALNAVFPAAAQAENAAAVHVRVPVLFQGQEANFVAAAGAIDVMPDVAARVIINERTGTVVATQTVRISTVAISHGSLLITVASTPQVSQPSPFSDVGETTVTETTETEVIEQRGKFAVVADYPTIEQLTSALNALGVSTREMIAILQTLKRSGALQAELVLH